MFEYLCQSDPTLGTLSTLSTLPKCWKYPKWNQWFSWCFNAKYGLLSMQQAKLCHFIASNMDIVHCLCYTGKILRKFDMMDELRNWRVTYWHFGWISIIQPGIEWLHFESPWFESSAKLISWPKYWKSCKVPLSNPPVFSLIHHVKFPQNYSYFIQAIKSKNQKTSTQVAATLVPAMLMLSSTILKVNKANVISLRLSCFTNYDVCLMLNQRA